MQLPKVKEANQSFLKLTGIMLSWLVLISTQKVFPQGHTHTHTSSSYVGMCLFLCFLVGVRMRSTSFPEFCCSFSSHLMSLAVVLGSFCISKDSLSKILGQAPPGTFWINFWVVFFHCSSLMSRNPWWLKVLCSSLHSLDGSGDCASRHTHTLCGEPPGQIFLSRACPSCLFLGSSKVSASSQ